MKTYEIEDFYKANISLLDSGPIITAETGRKALDTYLKQNNIKVKVKVSGGNDVHFKVTPVVIENGRKYIDRRGGQRAMWYAVIPEKI